MRTVVAASFAAFASSAALAYDPIVLARGWERVDAFEGEQCAGEVGSNGRFYVLSVSGLTPEEPAFLTITNGDMKPIEREVRANSAGEWQEYYIPFRYNRGEGDYVSVTLAGETCVVPLGFEWRRAKGWEVPAPLIPR
jgi:hypothetical protein